MHHRLAAAGAALMMFAAAPAAAQNSTSDPAHRFSIEFGLGSHLYDGGDAQQVAIGINPHRDMTILVNAQRDFLPTRVDRYPDGYSATRGGRIAFVSGEFRYTVPVGRRISPYGLAGTGFGVQRVNVNEFFPYPRGNETVHVFYVGGGARIRLHPRLDLLTDARFTLYASRDADGFGAFMPVRAGLAWRF